MPLFMDLPAEVRLNIYQQFNLDLDTQPAFKLKVTCGVGLSFGSAYFQMKKIEPDSNGPVSKTLNRVPLLGLNRFIRAEYLDTLVTDGISLSISLDECHHEPFANLVPEPWKSLAQEITVLVNLSTIKELESAQFNGFSRLRKVLINYKTDPCVRIERNLHTAKAYLKYNLAAGHADDRATKVPQGRGLDKARLIPASAVYSILNWFWEDGPGLGRWHHCIAAGNVTGGACGLHSQIDAVRAVLGDSYQVFAIFSFLLLFPLDANQQSR